MNQEKGERGLCVVYLTVPSSASLKSIYLDASQNGKLITAMANPGDPHGGVYVVQASGFVVLIIATIKFKNGHD